jgi:II/X family phage/plasmid replication protein
MAEMIDWVTARIPLACEGLLNGGSVLSVSPDGEVEWRTDRRLEVVGSHSSKVTVRGGYGVVTFSGNPAKFLQGHNLFGPCDLLPLMTRAMQKLAGIVDLAPTPDDLSAWQHGRYTVSRIDIARMLDFGSPEAARKVLGVLGQVARTKYQGALIDSTTVYIGKRSRRQILKFYDKLAELRKHRLSGTLAPSWHHLLTLHAAGKVRAELTVGSKWLHESPLQDAYCWDHTTPGRLLDERLAVLEVSDTMRLTDDAVQDLPARLVPIYDAWRAGRDLRALYSKPHFYRVRRQLLDLAGVDIAKVQPRQLVTENEYLGGFPVGPLLRGPGVPIPAWAHGTDLLAL